MKKDSKWKDPMLNENSQRNINLNKLQILFPAVPVVSAISTSLRTCVYFKLERPEIQRG